MTTIFTPAGFAIQALAARFGFDPKEGEQFIAKELIKVLKMQAEPEPEPEQQREPEPESPKPMPKPTPRPRARKVQPTPDAAAAPSDSPPSTPDKPIKTKTPTAPKLQKPECLLPWCNHVLVDRCQAVTPNYGLFTQCMKAPGANGLCTACAKTVNADGVPKYGLIKERLDNPAWVSPVDGKAPQRFVQFWARKLAATNVTRDQIEAEAGKFGLTVPPEQWTKPEKPTRQRKPRSALAESSASGSDGESAPAAVAKPPAKKARKSKAQPKANEIPKPIELEPEEAAPTRAAQPPAPPATPPTEPESEPVDMVQGALATELNDDPYDRETEDESDDEVEEIGAEVKQVDHFDGQGPRDAVVDAEGNVFCYAAFVRNNDFVQVGIMVSGKFQKQ